MNSYTSYNIHDLIEINVSRNIAPWVLEQIDFQIGSFRSREEVNLKYKIIIEPYKNLLMGEANSLKNFHRSKFISARFLEETQKNLAIKKESNGYRIFTDTPVLINLFLQLLLVSEGMTFVHAAAVAKPGGGVILLPGAGGVGKTAIVGSMVKEKGYRLLGDDIVLLSENGKCFSFLRPFILKEYHKTVYPELFKGFKLESKSRNVIRESVKFIIKNAPLLDATQNLLKKLKFYNRAVHSLPIPKDYLAALPVEKIFGDDSTAKSGNVEKIIFLERYQGVDFEFVPISESALSNRIFSIIHYEWSDYMRQLFMLGSTELVAMDAYFEKVSFIIKSGIHGKNCRILRIPKNASPHELYNFFNKVV